MTPLRVGTRLLNPERVESAEQLGSTLYVTMIGGERHEFRGDEAWALWRYYTERSIDLLRAWSYNKKE